MRVCLHKTLINASHKYIDKKTNLAHIEKHLVPFLVLVPMWKRCLILIEQLLLLDWLEPLLPSLVSQWLTSILSSSYSEAFKGSSYVLVSSRLKKKMNKQANTLITLIILNEVLAAFLSILSAIITAFRPISSGRSCPRMVTLSYQVFYL